MNSDPYAPKRKLAAVPRQRPEPRLPIGRLRRLGVTPDEMRDAADGWAELSVDEKIEALAMFDQQTDAELRAALHEDRADRAPTEEPVPEGTIDVVLAWVGDDSVRAFRAAAAERSRTSPRPTLVGRLDTIAAHG